MKKAYISILSVALPAIAMAQSAFDAQQVSQSDFKGTARFMSMGGAFTALGGDLSTLNQNPAGIGLYRSNEVGATIDINMQSTKSTPYYPNLYSNHLTQTKVYCNNFGYVGATNLDGALRTLNWGATYNRATSFDRIYTGSMADIGTSLSNYIADYSNSAGYTVNQLGYDDYNKNFNPYWDGKADWMSVLAFNSYYINPTSKNTYNGLYNYSNSIADAAFHVRETGYVDEYNLSVGGNVENVVYWGLSVGITDLNYTRSLYYAENIYDGDVQAPAKAPYTTNGDAYTELNARKTTTGSGWNMKLGVIIKPVNELRIGLAVHTPTWYHLSESFDGWMNYQYEPVSYDAEGTPTIDTDKINSDESGSPIDNMDWHLNSPWKLMVGVAGVIGNKAILSADYQFDGYNSMKVSTPLFYNDWGGTDFQADKPINNDIKNYFKASNTLRLGVEYRVTPQFSVRAGYNYQTSNTKADIENGVSGPNATYNEVYTCTLDPSYTLDKTTQHITCGLGYRYKAWYIDAAYVYRTRESVFHAFTNYADVLAPQSKITDHNSSIVLSTGFKF